jgi:hypothetical protein
MKQAASRAGVTGLSPLKLEKSEKRDRRENPETLHFKGGGGGTDV